MSARYVFLKQLKTNVVTVMQKESIKVHKKEEQKF